MRTDECVELFNFCLCFGCFSEEKTFDFEKRGRRNSDSAVYLKANEEPPILRLQRDEAELRQKIIGLEQKINRMRIGTFVEGESFKYFLLVAFYIMGDRFTNKQCLGLDPVYKNSNVLSVLSLLILIS